MYQCFSLKKSFLQTRVLFKLPKLEMDSNAHSRLGMCDDIVFRITNRFQTTITDTKYRKCGLLLNNAIAIFGATLMSSSQLFRSIECLIIGRFFIGINCGLNTCLVPMYLSEIAPMNLRGALGTVSQLGVTIGLLLSQVLGLSNILGTSDGWPFLLGVAFVPAVLQLLLLPLCPESPRYLLITKGRSNEARHALTRLRCTSEVEDDMEEMRMEESVLRLRLRPGDPCPMAPTRRLSIPCPLILITRTT